MAGIKEKIRHILPPKILYYYYLRSARKACMPDLKRRVHDKVYNNSKEEKVKRNLTLEYHIIEKGLTMPEPRPGFGKAIVLSLGNTIFKYDSLGLSWQELEFKQSVSVLKEYKAFHQAINFTLDEDVKKVLDKVESKFKSITGVHQIHISREEYFNAINKPFDKFCRSRYSVRNYISEVIPEDVLLQCIDLAQKSPSFCNRQPSRVHIVKSPEKKEQVLAIQNGNRGFGHLAETLLVISSIISTTKDIHERNENHLNGGMFAMTLLNALHLHKIGACSLNWSVSEDREQKMRKIIDLADNEIPLMIISCGYLPDSIAIASSPRKPAKEITRIHN
ncbi:nitroreductase family protein [uncultured Draconibacterium sp.]|uniref:nitroreductase family protein n=1 Tax=uncultured Draconibacterium sp. TaxID=1573823 RepID=UPI002AA7168F|nr:nitroreductase family protein [uncultured Draconibacterium sp.]